MKTLQKHIILLLTIFLWLCISVRANEVSVLHLLKDFYANGNPFDGKPDLGHKPGHEFWREKAKAEKEGLTQKQFNDRMNDPNLYQWENPHLNRSHKYERK